jgi:hypothetical protein
MGLMPSLQKIALDDLESTKCVCGSAKYREKSFCSACYFSLPPDLQKQLYRPFSEGYAEVYDECKDYLKQETDRLK